MTCWGGAGGMRGAWKKDWCWSTIAPPESGVEGLTCRKWSDAPPVYVLSANVRQRRGARVLLLYYQEMRIGSRVSSSLCIVYGAFDHLCFLGRKKGVRELGWKARESPVSILKYSKYFLAKLVQFDHSFLFFCFVFPFAKLEFHYWAGKKNQELKEGDEIGCGKI